MSAFAEAHMISPFAHRPSRESTEVTVKLTVDLAIVMLYPGVSQVLGATLNVFDTVAPDTTAARPRKIYAVRATDCAIIGFQGDCVECGGIMQRF